MMQRVTLESSAIEAVSYDETKRTLDVEFREGHSYRYRHVPEFVYHALLNADSAGAFWNAVKDQFEYEKLE
ncbi:MAG: KTSC domain-containing protein [Verrucomicrobia bacterium]|nr:MAG: KTSC domain-containing protein [Verrucomicrobiota bacterium]